MKEEKFKRIVIGSTVTAVILLVFLVVFMVYQIISVSEKKNLEQELREQIALYQEIIATSEDDIEIYKSRMWLEMAARKLEMIGAGDVSVNTLSNASSSCDFQKNILLYSIDNKEEIVYEICSY